MKKALFFLLFIWILALPVLADYTVDSVTVTADVAENGHARVTSMIQLTFDAVTSEVSIPLPDTEVTKVSAGNFRCTTEKTDVGTNVVVKTSGGFAGVQTFMISYTVPYNGDGGGDFSLGLLSSRWQKRIGGCTFQIIMPWPMEDPEIISGYHGVLTEDTASLVFTESTLAGSVGEMMSYDSLKFSVTLPEGYFAVRRANVPMVSMTYMTLNMLLILVLMMIYWRLKLRSPQEEVTARVLPPEGMLPCQLPMALDGATCDIPAMILEWANLGYLSIGSLQGTAILTKLMEMGSERSRAEQQLFNRIFQRKTQVAATAGRFSAAGARFRRSTRRSLYRVIFDHTGGNPIFVQLPGRVLLALSIGVLVYRLLPAGGGYVVVAVLSGLVGFVYAMLLHSVTSRYIALRTWSWLSIAAWVVMIALIPLSLLAGALPELTVGLLSLLFSAIATAPGPRRSTRGAVAAAQTKGLQIFYRQVSWRRLQAYQSRSNRFFQMQLPRATALGVDKRFAKRFERLTIPQPEWLDLPSDPTHSAAALRKQLRPILRQLREAFR